MLVSSYTPAPPPPPPSNIATLITSVLARSLASLARGEREGFRHVRWVTLGAVSTTITLVLLYLTGT